MNKRQKEDRDKAVNVVARNFPAVTDPAKLQDDLYKLGLRAQNNAICLCNQENYIDQCDNLRKALARIETKHGVSLAAEIGGDPRGFCLHVIMPEGDYNTMGGPADGWGW